MKRFDATQVRRLVEQIARAAGVAEDGAGILADALVEADIQGISTHGVSRLNIYVKRIRAGLIDPKAEPRIARQRPAALAVDGADGLGQVQAVKTLERLKPLAAQYGVATATIRRSQHFGALSYYCNKAAEDDMILIAMTNCEPAMSPAGACEAFFGTNPIATSFPSNKGFPVRIDMATSVVARGNIIAAQKAGRKIPEGWALDPEGRPTTDPAAALAGTVMTMAGHKGAALAMMVELFSGVLSGAAIGNDVGSMYKHLDRKQDVGHFFCLIDIKALIAPSELRDRVDSMIDRIKACRRREDVAEILVPGEPEHRIAELNRRRGIPIGEQTVDELRSLCSDYDIAFVLKPADEANGQTDHGTSAR